MKRIPKNEFESYVSKFHNFPFVFQTIIKNGNTEKNFNRKTKDKKYETRSLFANKCKMQ